MASITDLPAELIDNILDLATTEVSDDTAVESLGPRRIADCPSIVRQQIINALAPTCRRFHEFFKQEQHRVIFLTKKNIFPRMVKLHRVLGSTPQPQMFQNTTQFVVDYEEDPFLPRSYGDKAGYGKIANKLDSLKGDTRKAGFKGMDEYWVSMDQVGREYIGPHVPLQRGHGHRLGLLAQLILLRLPNVEGVALPYCMMDLLQPLDVLCTNVRFRQRFPPRLTSLRVTKVDNGDGHPGITGMIPSRCGIFAKYGYIKDLLTSDLQTGLPPAEFIAFSWLTRLVLWHCAVIDPNHLDQALKRLNKLQTFVYTVKSSPTPRRFLCPMYEQYLALRFPETLTTLCIDAPLDYWYERYGLAPVFGGLQKLENLWVNAHNLSLSGLGNGVGILKSTSRHDRGYDRIEMVTEEGDLKCVPKSLKRLHMLGEIGRIREDVKWLEEAVGSGRLPNLEEIAVETTVEDEDGPEGDFWTRYEADLWSLDREKLEAEGVRYLGEVDPRPYMW
ncbi:hypothetical protein GCG54_00012761 [Colletotrichum gloeosporioides]|uniref:Uncharacterized protein n=1 Tax=Colletotrichum gloeosporioides TaxID=474922 RepID=A0A8H4FQI2_COLGL|nr:uncharacterized protein GCG54_00012761 [Colletotrichum gloeosporioides]KAF3809479.1 hypothetical protein GCG54_00012761 [Colletotrichum gloeosporioides]